MKTRADESVTRWVVSEKAGHAFLITNSCEKTQGGTKKYLCKLLLE